MNMSWEKYYENTLNKKPHDVCRRSLDFCADSGTVIDLGSRTGRDTLFLLEKGYDVIAVDREEDSIKIINELVRGRYDDKIKLIKADFTKIELVPAVLINAGFSLFFCNREDLYYMIEKIYNSLEYGGCFCGQILGERDSWTRRKDIISLNKNEILDIFKRFKIIECKEVEQDGKTALGNYKHWHYYELIVKKINIYVDIN